MKNETFSLKLGVRRICGHPSGIKPGSCTFTWGSFHENKTQLACLFSWSVSWSISVNVFLTELCLTLVCILFVQVQQRSDVQLY